MKTKSQLSCILFACVAACSGNADESGRVNPYYRDMLVPKPYVPASGFGDLAGPMPKPTPAKLEPVAPVAEPVAAIPTKAVDCIKLGKEAEAKGDHVRARELFTAATKLDKKSAEPHVELARSYIATNEKALAIRHAAKAVKLAPESSQAYNTLGRAELARFNYDAAIVDFRQATELNKENVWAWNNLGVVYLAQKNYQEAATALAEATSKKGAEGYMWNNLGTAYEQLDRLDDAREAFEAGAKLGSVAAGASRKRLEGVDTIAIAKKPAPSVDVKEKTYDVKEEMPEVPPADDKAGEPDAGTGDDKAAEPVGTSQPTTL